MLNIVHYFKEEKHKRGNREIKRRFPQLSDKIEFPRQSLKTQIRYPFAYR